MLVGAVNKLINIDKLCIGKGLLLSTGSMITGGEVLGNHIVVATSSVVTKSFLEGNALLVGMPAVKKVDRPDYYLLFKGESKQRVDAKSKWNLNK